MKKLKNEGCLKSCMKEFLVLSGLFLICALYSVGGAFVFIYLEAGAEDQDIKTKKEAAATVSSSKDYIIQNTWYLQSLRMDKKDFIFTVRTNLDMFHKIIVTSAREEFYDGKPNEWDYDWTFPKALLFTTTTVGAIGYGHVTPKTWGGQFFCIYYGMFGVPLLLLFLANIGGFLADAFRYIYSRLCCRWCRIRRVVTDLVGTEKKLEPRILWKDEVGVETYMATDNVDVPIMVNLVVIFAYLMAGGALFSYWENWQLYESIYFTFITLTTIGFGDYVPGNSFSTEGGANLMATIKMLVTIAFCLFGMALVSMAINLMQSQISQKGKWLAKEMGMTSEEEDESWRYNFKQHEPGSIHETPADKDGNQAKLMSAEDEQRLLGNGYKKKKSVHFS